jgi:hypothetical protein
VHESSNEAVESSTAISFLRFLTVAIPLGRQSGFLSLPAAIFRCIECAMVLLPCISAVTRITSPAA